MTLVVDILLFLAAFAFMEGFAWFTHRFVMHGALWVWHRSHHEPRLGAFERNDLFAVIFAAPAIVCIWFGVRGIAPLLPIGLGITAYGAAYAIFHDGLVHRRYPLAWKGRSPYWKRLIQAHRIHHAVATKHGCVSFGFLIAPPVRLLKARLAEKYGFTVQRAREIGPREIAGLRADLDVLSRAQALFHLGEQVHTAEAARSITAAQTDLLPPIVEDEDEVYVDDADAEAEAGAEGGHDHSHEFVAESEDEGADAGSPAPIAQSRPERSHEGGDAIDPNQTPTVHRSSRPT